MGEEADGGEELFTLNWKWQFVVNEKRKVFYYVSPLMSYFIAIVFVFIFFKIFPHFFPAAEPEPESPLLKYLFCIGTAGLPFVVFRVMTVASSSFVTISLRRHNNLINCHHLLLAYPDMHTMRSGHVKDLGIHPARGNRKSVADNVYCILPFTSSLTLRNQKKKLCQAGKNEHAVRGTHNQGPLFRYVYWMEKFLHSHEELNLIHKARHPSRLVLSLGREGAAAERWCCDKIHWNAA